MSFLNSRTGSAFFRDNDEKMIAKSEEQEGEEAEEAMKVEESQEGPVGKQ